MRVLWGKNLRIILEAIKADLTPFDALCLLRTGSTAIPRLYRRVTQGKAKPGERVVPVKAVIFNAECAEGR